MSLTSPRVKVINGGGREGCRRLELTGDVEVACGWWRIFVPPDDPQQNDGDGDGVDEYDDEEDDDDDGHQEELPTSVPPAPSGIHGKLLRSR